ncbi:MAG: hypothetical protein Tsb002_04230 [Wenzhouxiangellaceae bacterium]
MTARPRALLVLVHQGLSYLPEIVDCMASIGIQIVALSSYADRSKPFFSQTRTLSDWRLSDLADLNDDEVQKYLDSMEPHYHVIGAISTFEGYRILMARANVRLATPDISEPLLLDCLDKLIMRKRLREAGLSSAHSFQLDETRLAELQQSKIPYFIKPRCGVGSFGCLRLTPSITWSVINSLRQQLLSDTFLRVACLDHFDFIAESFIEGTECSFEIVACDGNFYPLAIHEKLGLEERDQTILENVDVSPAINLSSKQMQQGADYIIRCLRELELNEGAFHVEARFDSANSQWDIIEINPRIGGGLINTSVAATTASFSILDAWLFILTRNHHQQEFLPQLVDSSQRYDTPKYSTIGHYVFGYPGKRLKRVERCAGFPEPLKINQAAHDGDLLPSLSREIPVIEAIWRIPPTDLESYLQLLNTGWVNVEYVH